MRRFVLLSCIITLALFSVPLLGMEKMVIRLDNATSDMAYYYDANGYDVASVRPGEYLDLVVDNATFARLKQENPAWYISQTQSQLLANLTPQRDIPGYRDYNQVVSDLQQLQAQYPYLVQVHNIGDSWGKIYSVDYPFYANYNHSIWAVKVSANVTESMDKSAFYFVGEHHAREPISTEMCFTILEHLVENYGSDPEVTAILDESEVWIVPLLNPNGHKVVLDQQDIWWRKNMRDNNGNHDFDTDYTSGMGADGVDLNRNYGYRWGYSNTTDLQYWPSYHGPGPFSEPETQALANLLASRRFLAGISYHTHGQYVLYPFGYLMNLVAPDSYELRTLAQEIAGQILKHNSTNQYYDAMPSWQLYPVSGSSDDWIYGVTGAFAYTVEMATTFIPHFYDIPQITAQNLNGAMMLLKRGQKKMLTGHVTDAITGHPLPARIWVQDYDDLPQGYPALYANASFGTYYRLLPEGQHLVRYVLPGYQTQSRVVTILPDAVTVEDIQLEPTYPIALQITIVDVLDQPVADASLIFESDPQHVYLSNGDGLIVIPEFYPGEYSVTITKLGFSTLRYTRQIDTPNILFRLNKYAELNDGFESGMGLWITTGNWGTSSLYASEGSHSLTDSPNGNYAPNVNSWCKLADPLLLDGVDNVDLQFYIRHDLAQDIDHCHLQYSFDDQNWIILDTFMEFSDWSLKSYSLNKFIGSILYLRFLFYSDGNLNGDGVYIDDFRVYTGFASTPADTPAATPTSLNVYPNPFGKMAYLNIRGIKPDMANPRIAIYNLRGQRVWEKTLLRESKNGEHLAWDGRDMRGNSVASGIYLIRLYDGNRLLAGSKVLRIN